MSAASQIGRALCLKLLKQADRGGRPTLAIKEASAKDYFNHSDLASRQNIHAFLENAQQAGGLTLEWGRDAASEDLLRLRIADIDKLAQWLGVQRAAVHADQMAQALGPVLENAASWLHQAYQQALQRWRQGRGFIRIANDDVGEALAVFKIALAVSENQQADLDLRRFSVNLLGDSKGIENRFNRLANLLRFNPDWAELEKNADLFRLLGLEKFPPPLFIKGPLEIRYGTQQWDISALRPFIGLSPDQANGFRATCRVAYLLTIENLASYQRHVREIDDDGIVIYTAGFPAPALMNLLTQLDQTLPETCLFFHWGDQDVGGLRIFSRVAAACTRRDLIPHLMDQTPIADSRFSKQQRQQLERIQTGQTEAGRMANRWLCASNPGPVEQEQSNPQQPSLKRAR